MIYLNKIIPILVSPIFIVTLLALLNIVLLRRWVSVLMAALLLIASNPVLGAKSRAYLEKDFSYVPVSEVEPVDAVVVLSGMLVTLQSQDGEFFYEFNGAVDRFNAGIEFIKQNKAKTLVLTKGQLPWSEGEPEGQVLMRLAIERGVSPNQIQLTEKSQNTEQEAQAVKDLLHGNQGIALVTSAFHMPRALDVFRAQGLEVTPYAVDFSSHTTAFTLMDLMPSANALAKNSLFVREMIGRLYYAIKTQFL